MILYGYPVNTTVSVRDTSPEYVLNSDKFTVSKHISEVNSDGLWRWGKNAFIDSKNVTGVTYPMYYDKDVINRFDISNGIIGKDSLKLISHTGDILVESGEFSAGGYRYNLLPSEHVDIILGAGDTSYMLPYTPNTKHGIVLSTYKHDSNYIYRDNEFKRVSSDYDFSAGYSYKYKLSTDASGNYSIAINQPTLLGASTSVALVKIASTATDKVFLMPEFPASNIVVNPGANPTVTYTIDNVRGLLYVPISSGITDTITATYNTLPLLSYVPADNIYSDTLIEKITLTDDSYYVLNSEFNPSEVL